MKKLLFPLLILLSSCSTMMLSQVPPQKIYAGADCSALLPDYRLQISATDNCEVSSLTQIPAPGYLLSAGNKVTTVIVKATDGSGNYSQISFTVTLIDTVKPVLTIDPELLEASLEQIQTIYDFGDRLVAHQEAMLDRQVADTTIFPESEFPGLRDAYQDSTYYKKMMLTWTSPGHAVTGYGGRWITWMNETDSILIRR